MEDNKPIESHNSGSWTLIRDAAVLQVKLVVDGLRDFLLVPASLIAAIASLVTAKDGRPGPPGESKKIHGKIYLVDSNAKSLVRRYQRDFPVAVPKRPADPSPKR